VAAGLRDEEKNSMLETALEERRKDNLTRAVSFLFKFACALGLGREPPGFQIPLSEDQFIRQWRVVEAEFDAEFYRALYRDVARAEVDPLAHFLDYGWREGRSPNPSFSVRRYLRANPDVAKAKVNPFYHYLQYGRREGRTDRSPRPVVASTQTTENYLSWPADQPNTSARVAITYAKPRLPRLLLGIFDMATRQGQFIFLSGFDAQICGRGLTQDANTLYVAFTEGSDSFLAFFDKSDLTLRDVIGIPRVVDVHSICLHQGALFAVSTGTDELVRITYGAGGTNVETVWSPTNSHIDQQHVNSVISFRGELVCSAFGRRSGYSWNDARDGYVYNVSAGEYIVRAICNPHSLAELTGRLYLCESSLSAIRPIVFSKANRANLGPSLDSLDGYVRGLGFSPDGVGLVGTSVGRYAGYVGRVIPSDDNVPGRRLGRCAAQFVDPRTATVQHCGFEFSAVSDEIYDIAWLTNDRETPAVRAPRKRSRRRKE
jgi:hypothetical protein